MPRKRSRNRKLVAVTGLVAVAIVLLVLFDPTSWELSEQDLGGSMAGSTSTRMGVAELSGSWDGSNDLEQESGSLFQLDFDAVTGSGGRRTEEFRVYFSRDDEFDRSSDCLVERRTVELEAATKVHLSFKTDHRLVNCLDAGPWRAALHITALDEWHLLPDTYDIPGGRAELALKAVYGGIPYQGELALEVSVNRQATALGAQGLYDHGVDVWLRQDDQLCVIEAPTLSVPRDPVRRNMEEWHTTTANVTVSAQSAMKVDTSGGFGDPFESGQSTSRSGCAYCNRPRTVGACTLTEGMWELAVGPATRDFFRVGEVYAHASPTRMDPGKIKLSLTEGQVITVDRDGFNPSRESVRWSLAQEGGGQQWLLGRENQVLRGSRATNIELTVSAARLEPGFYSGAFVFTAQDYYQTEIRIPVELRVERSRNGNASSQADPIPGPASFALENFPNPFSGRTTIRLNVPEAGNVKIAVYDLAGREVRVLHDQWMTSGPIDVSFEAGGLPSGTYLYRVTTPAGSASKTMTLVN